MKKPENRQKDVVDSCLSDYNINTLMEQTRALAADYRDQTGQALPVTEELARFDVVSLLGLQKIEKVEGVDAVNPKDLDIRYLIKGRVLFKGGKARQKLGKLSLNADWNKLLMVIYDAKYQAKEIYQVDRAIIETEMAKLSQDKRGSMTVAKYKAMGIQVWNKPS